MLANAVIPNEYGIDPGGKLRIGSKICAALLGKILADLGNMREESIATANVQVSGVPQKFKLQGLTGQWVDVSASTIQACSTARGMCRRLALCVVVVALAGIAC